MSKRLTLGILEVIERYYNNIAVVFSSRAGFHIHVLDFNYKDSVDFRSEDPIWCHHASRFKFTRLLKRQAGICFNKAHFNVSVDPMRVVTVPGTLNAKTGLVCSYLGDRKTFERMTIRQIVEGSRSFCKYHLYGYPESSTTNFLQRVYDRRC